jgi:hypothetical protein
LFFAWALIPPCGAVARIRKSKKSKKLFEYLGEFHSPLEALDSAFDQHQAQIASINGEIRLLFELRGVPLFCGDAEPGTAPAQVWIACFVDISRNSEAFIVHTAHP